MYSGIFDTHAHYDHKLFDFIRHATISGMPEMGVSLILNCGSDEESSLFSLELADEYDFLYSAVGIHPHAASRVKGDYRESILNMLSHKKALAVGEIGLDYHYNFSDPVSQRRIFTESLEIALETNLPVIIHDRDAHNDILAMLKEYRPIGVIHRFSGDMKMMEEILQLDMYLGYGCSVVYENAKNERETVSFIPIERLLLETDCPYLAPPNNKNELCRSDMISYAAETISLLRPSYTSQQIIDIAAENGKRLFGI